MSAGKEKNIELHNPKSDYTSRNNGTTPFYREGEQTAASATLSTA